MDVKTIKWIDSSMARGWFEEGQYIEPALCTSVGFVIREDDVSIMLAQSINTDDNYGNLLIIPKVSVID